MFGSAEVVAELAGRVGDVDALENGVTALWEAVIARKPANARALAAAGADPLRLLLGGWSPGRLSLAGPTPELFSLPDSVSLTDTERAAAQEVIGSPQRWATSTTTARAWPASPVSTRPRPYAVLRRNRYAANSSKNCRSC
ncbi:hypothetical protein [Streptomyces sp. NPDC004286]|uniref:hypothetical protein n=1 Tax=Streptomyces sp. NPDC004286 TaxID=3364696 RepID=UPI00367CF7CE